MFAGIVSCGIAAAFTACSDTWDDHYDSLTATVHEGSLWQTIQQNPDLSNFASVLKATGYDKALASSQVFTVFAPINANFSKEEADRLISEFNAQKNVVNEEDNIVIKEFVQNHMALYNHSVSSLSNDSITLMNGKYAVLNAGTINGVTMLTKNQLYENGVLYTVEQQVGYLPNVFEYVRNDEELDSLRSFLYNSHYYYKMFQPSLSVPGGIENGQTVYLDSVFRQVNELFDYLGDLSTEDSTYWMVAPTNKVWSQLIDEYEPYFNYAPNILERDSMVYTNVRMAIVNGTTFSRTFNPDPVLRDSAISTAAMERYSYRESMWGAPFHYYQYDDPLKEGGVLSSPSVIKCSNGQVFKTDDWQFNKLLTFCRYNIIDAENSGSIKEIQKDYDTKIKDSVRLASPTLREVSSDNRFYNKVWSHCFVEFEPQTTTKNYTVTFNITDVLSNMGYDIYMVYMPAFANDSNATGTALLPNKLRCTLSYLDTNGKRTETRLIDKYNTNPNEVEYILLAEDFKFPICTYDLNEDIPSTMLQVTTQPTNAEIRNGTHNRTLRIDCILLVPHGTLAFEEGKVLMYPHGITTRRTSYWEKER